MNIEFITVAIIMLLMCYKRILFVSSFNTSACQQHGASPVEKVLLDHETNLTSGYTFIMTTNERFQLMHELLLAKKYFEFGCGGSTILASRLIAMFNLSLSITSVDSSSVWISKIREDPVLANLELAGKFFAHEVYIGELGQWGHPSDSANISLWPSYSYSIWKYGRDADLILVDGRFRVACALHAVLLSYTHPGTNLTTLFSGHSAIRADNTTTSAANSMTMVTKKRMRSTPRKMKIVIRDFLRQQYHKVLHYADVISCVDSLVVLHPKKLVDLEQLVKDIYAHEFQPNRM